MTMQSVKDITAQIMPTADLLERLKIEPVRLISIGDGVYEAQWTPEASTDGTYYSDLEILGITTAVKIIGTTFEPEGWPGWTAVRFSYTPPVEVAESSVQPDPAELENKYALPDLPADARGYGEQIEHVKLILHEMSRQLSEAKEIVAVRKDALAREVAADPDLTNETKRKAALAMRLSQDPFILRMNEHSLWLSDMIAVWDARRSRLNRDFEVARIDYEYQQRSKATRLEAQLRQNKP